MHTFYVYIMGSHSGVLYVGLTNDIRRRTFEHKGGKYPRAFTLRYRVRRLLYYENLSDLRVALAREKQLKRWTRKRKVQLIEKHNAGWLDLSVGWWSQSLSQTAPDPSQGR